MAAALSTNICCEIARCLDRIHIVVFCVCAKHRFLWEENNYITGRTRAKKSENGRICL